MLGGGELTLYKVAVLRSGVTVSSDVLCCAVLVAEECHFHECTNAVALVHGAKGSFEQCVFSENAAVACPPRMRPLRVNEGFKAAVWVLGATATFTECIFKMNRSSEHAAGGAVYARQTAYSAHTNVLFDSCTFHGNKTNTGGAVHLQAATGTFHRCIFGENKAGSHGGAADLCSGAKCVFTECAFTENKAIYGSEGVGGAVCVLESAVTFTNCTFSASQAKCVRTPSYAGLGSGTQ